MKRFDVAVLGGGAAGTFFVSEVLRRNSGWRVLWAAPPDSPGVAYSSRLSAHLLNVPAEKMGAFVDQPDHFHEWLKASQHAPGYGPKDFVPRRIFGEYLLELARSACQDPSIEATSSRVTALEEVNGDDGTWWLMQFDNGTQACARRVVLATGVPVKVGGDVAREGLVRDPWDWLLSLPDDWTPPGPSETVVIIGSGLTAVDIVLALRDLGFRGSIRVLARSGRWSAAHEAAEPLSGPLRAELTRELLSAPTCRSYLRVLRRHSASWPWRAVIDSLRPLSQQLWEALPLEERRRFLRHLFGLWNRHRHRTPPTSARRLSSDPGLSIQKMRTSAEAIGRWIAAGEAALVIDCRGPGLASRTPWPTFLQGLRDDGVLSESALGVGVVTHRPAGVALLGAARFGEEFECTAVPELRGQACSLVDAWQATDRRDRSDGV